jgi:ACT domain-containing protein
MKRLSELIQGIKHTNPLKESNEAKLLCSNAFYKYREVVEPWKQKQVKSY